MTGVLAESDEGYRNLIRLVSHAHVEGFYYRPRVDKEILRRLSEEAPTVGVVGFSRNFGQHYAMTAGFDRVNQRIDGLLTERRHPTTHEGD